MQFHVICPPPMEAIKLDIKDNQMDITPMTVRGQHVLRVCYVTAVGNNGTEAKGVVLFNANTGDFSVQRLDGDPVNFAFDKTPAEFNNRRDTIKRLKRSQATAARDKKTVGVLPPVSPPIPLTQPEEQPIASPH